VGKTDSEIIRMDWRRLIEETNRFLKEKENHRERDSPADKLQLRKLGMKPKFLRFDHGICLQDRSAMLRHSHLIKPCRCPCLSASAPTSGCPVLVSPLFGETRREFLSLGKINHLL
jgi:hypothetical protein